MEAAHKVGKTFLNILGEIPPGFKDLDTVSLVQISINDTKKGQGIESGLPLLIIQKWASELEEYFSKRLAQSSFVPTLWLDTDKQDASSVEKFLSFCFKNERIVPGLFSSSRLDLDWLVSLLKNFDEQTIPASTLFPVSEASKEKSNIYISRLVSIKEIGARTDSFFENMGGLSAVLWHSVSTALFSAAYFWSRKVKTKKIEPILTVQAHRARLNRVAISVQIPFPFPEKKLIRQTLSGFLTTSNLLEEQEFRFLLDLCLMVVITATDHFFEFTAVFDPLSSFSVTPKEGVLGQASFLLRDLTGRKVVPILNAKLVSVPTKLTAPKPIDGKNSSGESSVEDSGALLLREIPPIPVRTDEQFMSYLKSQHPISAPLVGPTGPVKQKIIRRIDKIEDDIGTLVDPGTRDSIKELIVRYNNLYQKYRQAQVKKGGKKE